MGSASHPEISRNRIAHVTRRSVHVLADERGFVIYQLSSIRETA